LPCQPPRRWLPVGPARLRGKRHGLAEGGRTKFHVPRSSGPILVTTQSAAPRRPGSGPRSAPG
jgi:hypothetical protein